MRKLILVGVSLVLLAACRPAEGEAGAFGVAIKNVGSDTIVNLAVEWAEAYQAVRPDMRITVTGGGSGTGIAGLINGAVDIANASRQMKPEELEAAEANGITPVEHVIARDAIAIVIHPSNPVDRLTLQQLSDIFSGRITNWSEVGGEDWPIVLLSRGLGYVTPDQKTIAVAKESGGPFVMPMVETVNSGEYPIARDLYMYTAGEPEGTIAEYLDWIRSPEGQAIVGELGFVPLEEDQ